MSLTLGIYTLSQDDVAPGLKDRSLDKAIHHKVFLTHYRNAVADGSGHMDIAVKPCITHIGGNIAKGQEI